jgi:hypothetical protein
MNKRFQQLGNKGNLLNGKSFKNDAQNNIKK